MVLGNEATRIVELEEQWKVAAAAATNDNSPETDAATCRSLRVMSEIAQTPAANMTDVAVKIGIAVRELRHRFGDAMLALLLASAEQDCLRLTERVLPDYT